MLGGVNSSSASNTAGREGGGVSSSSSGRSCESDTASSVKHAGKSDSAGVVDDNLAGVASFDGVGCALGAVTNRVADDGAMAEAGEKAIGIELDERSATIAGDEIGVTIDDEDIDFMVLPLYGSFMF